MAGSVPGRADAPHGHDPAQFEPADSKSIGGQSGTVYPEEFCSAGASPFPAHAETPLGYRYWHAAIRAQVAQAEAAEEMNWSLPWGKPVSK